MKEVIEIAVANYSQMIITLMIIKLINLKEDIIIKKLYLIMKILTMIIKMIKVDQTIQLEIVKAFCKFNNKDNKKNMIKTIITVFFIQKIGLQTFV